MPECRVGHLNRLQYPRTTTLSLSAAPNKAIEPSSGFLQTLNHCLLSLEYRENYQRKVNIENLDFRNSFQNTV